MIYRYVLASDYQRWCPELIGVAFENDWLKIKRCVLTIKAGYAWDGCSPTWKVGKLWLGTPDGSIRDDGKPTSYEASLVHDAFCQFSGDVPVTKRTVTAIFVQMLIEGGFSKLRAKVYGVAVWLFGPQSFGQNVQS